MFRSFLGSLALLTIVLTGCDPEVLIAKPDNGSYEIVALTAD